MRVWCGGEDGEGRVCLLLATHKLHAGGVQLIRHLCAQGIRACESREDGSNQYGLAPPLPAVSSRPSRRCAAMLPGAHFALPSQVAAPAAGCARQSVTEVGAREECVWLRTSCASRTIPSFSEVCRCEDSPASCRKSSSSFSRFFSRAASLPSVSLPSPWTTSPRRAPVVGGHLAAVRRATAEVAAR